MRKSLFSILLAVVCFAKALATDYFVSPSGLDSNPGTKELPFRNLSKAIAKAYAGTTIYLREGIYKPTVDDIMKVKGEGGVYDCVFYLSADGTSKDPITISGYPGESAVIDI